MLRYFVSAASIAKYRTNNSTSMEIYVGEIGLGALQGSQSDFPADARQVSASVESWLVL